MDECVEVDTRSHVPVALWLIALGVGSVSLSEANLSWIGVERVAVAFLVAAGAAAVGTIHGCLARCGSKGEPPLAVVGALVTWGKLPALYIGLMVACRLLPEALGSIFGAVAACTFWVAATLGGGVGVIVGLVALWREERVSLPVGVVIGGGLWLALGNEVGMPRIDLTWEGAAQRQCNRFMLEVERAARAYGARGGRQPLAPEFDAACDQLAAAGLLGGRGLHMNDDRGWPGVTRFWRLEGTWVTCAVHGRPVDPDATRVPGWRKLRRALPGPLRF